MPRENRFKSSNPKAPVIPPAGSTIEVLKPQFVLQDELATTTKEKKSRKRSRSEAQKGSAEATSGLAADEIIDVPDVTTANDTNGASGKKSRKRAKTKGQAVSKGDETDADANEGSRESNWGPYQAPQNYLPPTLRTEVEKRAGEDFWTERVHNPYKGAPQKGDRLKRWLRLDPQLGSKGDSWFKRKVIEDKDAVLALSGSGAHTLVVISAVETAVRECAPREGEEGVDWFRYESLGSEVKELVPRKRGRTTRGRGRKVDKTEYVDHEGIMEGAEETGEGGAPIGRAADEISIDGDSEFGGFDNADGGMAFDGAKQKEGEEEPAFETMDVDGKAKNQEDNPEKPKVRAFPVLTIWLSKKSIPEFKEAFGEKIIKISISTKSVEEGQVMQQSPTAQPKTATGKWYPWMKDTDIQKTPSKDAKENVIERDAPMVDA